MIEQEHTVAVLLERIEVVTHQHDRLALALVPVERVEAFLLEARIADGKHLIHDQEVRLSEDRDAECQPDLHARGEVLELLLGEILELRKGEYFVYFVAQLCSSETQHGATEKDVLASRQLRIEADAEF